MRPLQIPHLLLFLLFPTMALAQEPRTLIEGQLLVPEGSDPEGVHVYNKTANLGTISVADGHFQLKMAEGDTLYFTSVQFENLELRVDKASVESGKLLVVVRDGLNELPEIVIRPHELTGNIEEDIKQVEIEGNFHFPPLKPDITTPTGATSTPNSLHKEIGGGANHLQLLIKGIKALLPKKKKKDKPELPFSRRDKIEVEKAIRERFDPRFFLANFRIAESEIGDFLAFCIDDHFDKRLVQEHREMELIEYLIEKREEFKAR